MRSRRAARPLLHVVAGVLIDDAGRVLIAERPAGKHLAGRWEFPGGKLEPGEERTAGLARELREELGITLGRTPLRPLMRVRHAYPTREVLLDTWVVRQYQGEPRGLDGQALRWCSLEDLMTVELLPADAPIVQALRLPERLTVRQSAAYILAEEHDVRLSLSGPGAAPQLRGAYADSSSQALSAALNADFLAMRSALAPAELTALCAAIGIPVYARGASLAQVWSWGASGINDLPA